MNHRRFLLLLQIPATLAIIAWVPGNLSKLASLGVLWALTFQTIDKSEILLFAGVCIFFTVMNTLSLQQGIFAFSSPDLLGMPSYELFMWGFYILHIKRMLNGTAPEGKRAWVWLLALLYATCFATLTNATSLLGVTAALLLIGLAFFHEPLDWAYTGYMIALGAAIEYTGVYSGQWHYPGNPIGGVPFWFITLWGGVGWFFHRLVMPLLQPKQPLASSIH